MSEDIRQSLFDAVALGIARYAGRLKKVAEMKLSEKLPTLSQRRSATSA
ncbi:hypothetical protein FHS91_002916 [Sphingobium xanthum]|nr:hypothetical protein [Sphingobium xanthum]